MNAHPTSTTVITKPLARTPLDLSFVPVIGDILVMELFAKVG